MDVAQQNRNISQYAKGNVIYEERAQVRQIALLIKGCVIMESAGVKDVLYPGSFLGAQDVFAKNYLCTYRALEDTIVCTIDVESEELLYDKITVNSDYCGLVIASLGKQLSVLYGNYEALYNSALNSYNSIQQYSKLYENISYAIKLEKEVISKAQGFAALEKPQLNQKLGYYCEIGTFTIDSIRAYFSQGKIVVCHHMKEISELYHELIAVNQKLILYIMSALDILGGSVYFQFTDLAKLAKNRGKSIDQIIQVMQHMIDTTKGYKDMVESMSNKSSHINCESMEEIYVQLLSGEEDGISALKEERIDENLILNQCFGALDTILSYAAVDHEQMSSIKADIQSFAKLKNRLSIDDEIRALRHKISKQFYEIYEIVFLKAYEDTNQPLPIQLFLKFGFMDDTLLEPEQIVKLYQLNRTIEGGRFKVYTMYEWLTSIYDLKREPSKNELDLDYIGYLKEELVARHINQNQYNEMLNDRKMRLHFEITNFFQHTNRISNGKVTTFLPVLYKEMFFADMDRLWTGAHKIEATLQCILDIDYSLFYREASYSNKEKRIDKEYVMMEVLPEFILTPTVGSNGIMWQTHSGFERDTPARIVLPMFMEGNLHDSMLKICARFRWEMCRAVQGSVWNNIKYKSLTSEYLDYIQFYRKNRELSEEKREKVKLQIQKCSNRAADVFALDYESWIKGESQGAIRLNKVARAILAMYCPFEKSIRARIMIQPLFAEPIQAFELERQKKAREVSNRYRMLQNKQAEITDIMMEALDFYQNL